MIGNNSWYQACNKRDIMLQCHDLIDNGDHAILHTELEFYGGDHSLSSRMWRVLLTD